jgi:putative ABC transport system permease protein
MYMNVGEKTREIGILRSMGSSTGQVFWLFFSQSLTLGVIGAALGMGAGVFLTSIFKQLINFFSYDILSPQELATIFSVSYVPYLAMGAAAGVLTTIIGGVFPSISASRVNIIKSLRPTMRKAGKQRTALKLIGVGLPLSLFGVLEYLGVIPYGDAGWGILMVSLLVPIMGIIFLTAGLLRIASRVLEYLLFVFRSSSKVISRNIDRNLLKSTACFTMIGLSLSFLVVVGGAQTGVVTGIEDVIKSYISCDLTVVSETSLSRYFTENLTNLNGGSLISNATPAFIIPQEIVLLNNASDTKTTVTVVAMDPSTYPEVMPMTFNEDTPLDVFDALNSSEGLILTAPLAMSLNVSVNDELKMPMASVVEVPIIIPNPALNEGSLPDIPGHDDTIPGGLPYPIDIPSTITVFVPEIRITYVNFTVVGISEGAWLRAASFGGIQLSKTCYISYNSLGETFPEYEDKATVFFAEAKSSLDVERAREQVIESYGDEYELDVITRDEVLNDVAGEIDKIFLSLYIPVLFAVLNAVIGVLSIMIMNVSTRRREIGILRSQGMSRSQLVASIVGEVLVLGLVGFVIALGLGLIFQSIVVTFMNIAGFIMPFTISLSAIQLALVQAVVISVISAAYPAYRAAKLDIVDSLRAT